MIDFKVLRMMDVMSISLIHDSMVVTELMNDIDQPNKRKDRKNNGDNRYKPKRRIDHCGDTNGQEKQASHPKE